jgi:hypothetical protein
MRSPAAITAVLALALSAVARAGSPTVGMTVTPAGAVTLTLAGRPVATGTWGLRPETYLLADGAIAIDPRAPVTRSAEQDDGGRVTIHERRPHVAADFTLDLKGEDLHVRAHVANADPTHPIQPIGFTGLTFHFNPAARRTGYLPEWHWTYLKASGLQVFHPSMANPLGCWFAADDRFGFSAFSASEFDRQFLIAAEWVPPDDTVPAECLLNVYTDRPVPANGSVDVDWSIRLSADRAMRHLIAPYKAVFDRHFPLPMQATNHGWIAFFGEIDSRYATPTNPLGYAGPEYRFDTARGTQIYIARHANLERRLGFMGHIFWSPGGAYEPMYPPDFDVLPAAVQANIPALVKGFHDQGLRVGLCARPGDGVRRPAGELYRLSADDPEQMRVLRDRFRHAMAMGFDLFYLDSIGGTGGQNDVRIIRTIRDTVGPDVQLYSEYCTDMSLPFAGRYCECWPGDRIYWNSPETFAALRYLCPDATWLCASKDGTPYPRDYAQLGVTPLVLDQNIRTVPMPAEVP